MEKKKRILQVDSEVGITRIYSEENNCFDMKAENEAIEALLTASRFQHHLILVDVSMTDRDGGEVATCLK